MIHFCMYSESVESKMPLLWSKALHLCQRQCEYTSDYTTGVRYLLKIAQCVTQSAEHRAGAGWGLLGAIGICKPHTVSNKYVVLFQQCSLSVLFLLCKNN